MSLERSFSPPLREAREWLLAGAFGCVLALFGALLLQHAKNMQPCAWCVFQRLVYLGLAAACLTGALMVSMSARLMAVGAGIVLALIGLWAALYQQFVASQTDSCGLTFADKLIMALNLHQIAPWMFVAYAPCNKANIALLGVPFALWSALLFVLLGLAVGMAGRALLRSRRGLFG